MLAYYFFLEIQHLYLFAIFVKKTLSWKHSDFNFCGVVYIDVQVRMRDSKTNVRQNFMQEKVEKLTKTKSICLTD